MFCFSYHIMYVSIFFRVAWQALGQSFDCPSACEVIQKYMAKISPYLLTTKYNKTPLPCQGTIQIYVNLSFRRNKHQRYFNWYTIFFRANNLAALTAMNGWQWSYMDAIDRSLAMRLAAPITQYIRRMYWCDTGKGWGVQWEYTKRMIVYHWFIGPWAMRLWF